MHTKHLKLAGLSLLVWSTFSVAQDNPATPNNRAVLISVVGSNGVPADANITGSIRQLIGHAIADGTLDDFNIYLPENNQQSPQDSGFTGCADAGANISRNKFSNFINKLQSITAQTPTIVYLQPINGSCNLINIDPLTCSLNGGACPFSAATTPISAITPMSVGATAPLTAQTLSSTYTPHCQTLLGGISTCYIDKYGLPRYPAPSGTQICATPCQ